MKDILMLLQLIDKFCFEIGIHNILYVEGKKILLHRNGM